MKVTVFGATGRLVVADLLTAGHTVTAYVRNAGKVPPTWPPDLRLIIEAMKRHGVERFIGNGTPSIIDKRDNPNLQQKLIGFLGRTMLPRSSPAAAGRRS